MYEEEGDGDDAEEDSLLILLYGTYFGFGVSEGSSVVSCCLGSFLLLILSEASSNLDAGEEEGDKSLILEYWTYFGF